MPHSPHHTTRERNQEPVAVGTIDVESTAPARVVLSFDDLQAKKRLVGKPVWFEFTQDETDSVVLGQITSVRAVCGGDVTVSSRTHCGTMVIGSVFSKSGPTYMQSALVSIPAAGTPVFELDNKLISGIVGGRTDTSYVGRFYGSDASFPVSLPPFVASGAGPYNIGIYGARGSGKTALIRTLIASLARSPASSVFAIDPDGSLTGWNDGASNGHQGGLLGEACRKVEKRFYSYDVGDLVLDRWDLFHDVLRESDMLRSLLPDEDRRDVFMGVVKAKFRTGGKYPMAKLRERGAYDVIMELLGNEGIQEEIYPTEKHVRTLFAKRVDAWSSKAYETHWLPLAELFNPRWAQEGVRRGALRVRGRQEEARHGRRSVQEGRPRQDAVE